MIALKGDYLPEITNSEILYINFVAFLNINLITDKILADLA